MKFFTFLFALFFCIVSYADTHVNGYTRSDGTYVAPHNRSDRNDNQYDNWSTKGNTNPYTGQKGYKNPDG